MVLILLVLAAAVGFAIQNDQPVSLKYYFGWESISIPLFLWAFFSIFIGLILSGLLGSLSKMNLHSQIRQQKKRIAELEKRLEALRKGQSFSPRP